MVVEVAEAAGEDIPLAEDIPPAEDTLQAADPPQTTARD